MSQNAKNTLMFDGFKTTINKVLSIVSHLIKSGVTKVKLEPLVRQLKHALGHVMSRRVEIDTVK